MLSQNPRLADMGRPPIGKRPMTAAERQRRHRGTAFRDDEPAVTKPPVTKPEAPAVTKPPPVTKLPEDWDAAEALKVWFENATEAEREELRSGFPTAMCTLCC